MSNDNFNTQDAIVASSVNEVVATLHEATSGLLFTSESDYPMTVFQLSLTSSTTPTITAENAKSILLSTTNMPSNIHSIHRQDWTTNVAVEETSLDWFFRRYTIAQDWWEPSQHAELPRWKHLQSLLNQSIFDVNVFRVGQAGDCGLYGSIDIFVVGRCQCDPSTWVGVHTISVET
jgi:Nuclease A inhibitor-like protein